MASLDVFRELDSLRREIDEAFRGFGVGRPVAGTFLAPASSRRFPAVNLSEDDNSIYVEAVVPGIDPQQIDLSVLRNALTIAGERRTPALREDQVLHRSERGFGSFSRTTELPMEIDPDKVSAECRDGILMVTLGKAETAKPRKVTISGHRAV